MAEEQLGEFVGSFAAVLYMATKNAAGRPRRSRNPIVERAPFIAEQRYAVKR